MYNNLPEDRQLRRVEVEIDELLFFRDIDRCNLLWHKVFLEPF
jgi:hypothetical protein